MLLLVVLLAVRLVIRLAIWLAALRFPFLERFEYFHLLFFLLIVALDELEPILDYTLHNLRRRQIVAALHVYEFVQLFR